MLALGIDPGTGRTGYGFVQEKANGELEAIDYGVIETPAGMPMEQRLVMLFDQLNELISLHRPEIGAVEKLFFARNVTTAITVGQARGVVLLAMTIAGVELSEYTPNEIKQAVAGYGGAGKKQIQEMVRALLGLSAIPKPDDAADALAVAICHLHSYRYKKLIQDQ